MKISSILLLPLLALPLAAAVPNQITYQGRLTKSGVTTGGPHTFHACFTSGATTYSPCNDFSMTLPISGDFTLILTPPASVDWTGSPIQLQLTIDGQLLSPKDDFTSVPYALVASTAVNALTLSGPISASQVQLNGTAVFLQSWQSIASPDLIDAGKIQGPFPNNLSVQNGINMNNTKITALSPATAPDQAVRLDQVTSIGLPPGSIIPFGGLSAPVGFLTCDGSAVSRTTFAALFSAIGAAWGAGDGSTTFNLPDLRRRTAVGAGGTSSAVLGNTVGNMGGEESHTLTIAEMPAHNHGVNDPGHFHRPLTGGAFVTSGAGGGAEVGGGTSGAQINTTVDVTGITIQSNGGGGAHNNIQPSAVVNYIIKY